MGKLNNKRNIMDHPVIIAIVGVACICMSVFFFIMSGTYAPITREEAISYTGEFDRFEYTDDILERYFSDWNIQLCFSDGSCYKYNVYASAESIELVEDEDALEENTELHILVHPKNNYVLEIRTDDEELLNFESAQEALSSERMSGVAVSILIFGSGVLIIVFARMAVVSKRKEIARHESKKQQSNGDSVVLRYADYDVKSRTLLEANVDGYEICYRRVKSVNELVINGRVYDEKKAVLEFEHTLSAVVGGHIIEVGLDDTCSSYMCFDGKLIKRKLRLV